MTTIQSLIQERAESIDELVRDITSVGFMAKSEARSRLDGILRESILAGIKLGLELGRECVSEKDDTTDSSEYERADRIAWNACRQQTLTALDEKVAEVEKMV